MNNPLSLKHLFDKTLSSVRMHDLVKNIFTSLASKKRKYSMSKKGDMLRLYNEVINSLSLTYSGGKLHEKLVEFGIDTPSKFADQLNLAHADLLANGFNMKFISGEKLSAADRKGRKLVKTYGHGMNVEDVSEYANPERLIAIRTKYGNGPVMFYPFKGKILNNALNGIKGAYAYETKVNYYEVRPILYSSWLKLDAVHQHMTCVSEDNSDLLPRQKVRRHVKKY